jgi:hypothetical protein
MNRRDRNTEGVIMKRMTRTSMAIILSVAFGFAVSAAFVAQAAFLPGDQQWEQAATASDSYSTSTHSSSMQKLCGCCNHDHDGDCNHDCDCDHDGDCDHDCDHDGDCGKKSKPKKKK